MIKTISEMMRSGTKDPYPISNFVAVYGESQSGKTTLMIQLLWELSHKTGRPALIYDTEGGIADTISAWSDVWRAKWPKGNIQTRQQRDIILILKDHGFGVKIIVKDKIDVHRVSFDTPPLLKMAKRAKYCAICYDSCTYPTKIFGFEQQNFPARSDAYQLWNIGCRKIQDVLHIPIFQIHHGSKSPTSNSMISKMAGGNATQYPAKYIFCLVRPSHLGVRYIYTVRHPRYAPFTKNWKINLTDQGYVDMKTTPPPILDPNNPNNMA